MITIASAASTTTAGVPIPFHNGPRTAQVVVWGTIGTITAVNLQVEVASGVWVDYGNMINSLVTFTGANITTGKSMTAHFSADITVRCEIIGAGGSVNMVIL